MQTNLQIEMNKISMDSNMKKINTNTLPDSLWALLLLLVFVVSVIPNVFALPNHELAYIERVDGGSVQTTTPQKPKKKRKKVVSKKVEPKLVAVKASIWGGDGVIFEVKDKSVTIQYGCADGQIEQAFTTDTAGNFTVNGYHTRQNGGPVLIDSQPPRQLARYEGKITGDKMRLKVTLTASKEIIGEFVLQRGNLPEITRCY